MHGNLISRSFDELPTTDYDFKGYLLLAEDGSSCNVPLTDENVDTFGSVVQHKDRKQRPQVGIAYRRRLAAGHRISGRWAAQNAPLYNLNMLADIFILN